MSKRWLTLIWFFQNQSSHLRRMTVLRLGGKNNYISGMIYSMSNKSCPYLYSEPLYRFLAKRILDIKFNVQGENRNVIMVNIWNYSSTKMSEQLCIQLLFYCMSNKSWPIWYSFSKIIIIWVSKPPWPPPIRGEGQTFHRT